jgi:hypothetical protein
VNTLHQRILALLVAALTALATQSAIAQERLEIVATTGMIADAAREVGGDLVNVSALMGPGVDPHAYRQTRSDIVATAARISSCGMASISRHRWKSSSSNSARPARLSPWLMNCRATS